MKSRDGSKFRDGSTLSVLVIAGAMIVVPLAIYFSAYFACTKSWGKVGGTGSPCRVYSTCWQSLMFIPAAGIESALTGRDIHTAWSMK